MGCYTYFTDQEAETYTKVEDGEINKVLQQIREVWPVWYISEREIEYKKRIWGATIKEKFYIVYQSFGHMEYRMQWSCHGKKDVLNFLYGLNVGLNRDKYTELI